MYFVHIELVDHLKKIRCNSTKQLPNWHQSGTRVKHLPPEIIAGMFAIGGAFVGAIASNINTRSGQKWSAAKRDIHLLSDQVAAYHRLESLYMQRVAELDPKSGAARTVQTTMRDRVASSGETRPVMTSQRAKRIKERWQ